MSINFSQLSLVVAPGQTIALGKLVNVSASSSNPAYLVVNGFDRNEYTASSSDTTGSLVGNSHTLGFTSFGGDVRGAGIVFTYDAAAGRYGNATYGLLSQLGYTASASVADVTDISLFGTDSANIANAYAANGIALARLDASGFIDTLTIAAETGKRGTVPAQATPISIAAVAQTFVGAPWNMDGCWVLASTISAEAGASLPVQSADDMVGAANGEWMIAFNGPAGSMGDWRSMVRTGDMIGFTTSSGTGHITTCVSGQGSTALLIDNITDIDPAGMIVNRANDGSSKDVLIQPAHLAAQEWTGVADGSVVIFRLDTPVVSSLPPSLDLQAGESVNLSTLFAAVDPAGKAITAYQIHTATDASGLTVNGKSVVAASAETALTVSSLSEVTLDLGSGVDVDMVTVRAFNGSYWGDWTTISTNAAGMTAAGQVAIHRFFDRNDGTHFFTASSAEAADLAATRADLAYEGVKLSGFATMGQSPSSAAVYRFFDTKDGTHFYTANLGERDALLAADPTDMKYEGTAFYENVTPQAGDAAVYRFFDSVHGTHLFTSSASEKANILATRPDLVSEGIAFYAPG